jgi:hypothetical protein
VAVATHIVLKFTDRTRATEATIPGRRSSALILVDVAIHVALLAIIGVTTYIANNAPSKFSFPEDLTNHQTDIRNIDGTHDVQTWSLHKMLVEGALVSAVVSVVVVIVP